MNHYVALCRPAMILLLVVLASAAAGAWSTDPTVNNPVCLSLGQQSETVICSDGAGGAIVAWLDSRNEYNDVYAQRLDDEGNRMWTPLDGVVVCNYAGDQNTLHLAPDGEGGCYVVWRDRRPAPWQGIYAQRLDADGNNLWDFNGAIVFVGDDAFPTDILPIPANNPEDPGGVAIVWEDQRDDLQYDIYYQWLNRDGVNVLSFNGNPICTVTGRQREPRAVMIGEAAVVTWCDWRVSLEPRVFAQRLSGDPPTPQWTPDGIPLSDVTVTFDDHDLVSNADGTAFVFWRHHTTVGDDIWAQRVNADGSLPWGTSGVAVCEEPDEQFDVHAVADGAGAAIVAWKDYQSGSVAVQRVDAAGSMLWSPGGEPLTSTNAGGHDIIPCPGEGVIICWMDDRNPEAPDIYAQRVDLAGLFQWGTDGAAVSTADAAQSEPALCPDGAGGAIIAWDDQRNYVPSQRDIYAQQISRNGTLGPLSGLPTDDAAPVARLRVLPADPNPFSGVTLIAWEQPQRSAVLVEIYDVAGRLVARHRESGLAAGRWGYRFEARGRDGQPLPSGVYLYRVTAGTQMAAGKVILTR